MQGASQKAAAATAPEVIADYKLHSKKAGSGGLGVVYPAVHLLSNRRVALKLGSAFFEKDGPR
jgi:hypothetical protein